MPDHYSAIAERFSNNEKVSVYPFGLASGNGSELLSIAGDRSSTFKPVGNSIEVQFKDIKEFLKEKELRSVDLVKINIEGGEFDLLDHLLSSGLIMVFKNIQVQFHDFVPDAEVRMRAIKARLSETHSLTYEYEFVWENWQRKGP